MLTTQVLWRSPLNRVRKFGLFVLSFGVSLALTRCQFGEDVKEGGRGNLNNGEYQMLADLNGAQLNLMDARDVAFGASGQATFAADAKANDKVNKLSRAMKDNCVAPGERIPEHDLDGSKYEEKIQGGPTLRCPISWYRSSEYISGQRMWKYVDQYSSSDLGFSAQAGIVSRKYSGSLRVTTSLGQDQVHGEFTIEQIQRSDQQRFKGKIYVAAKSRAGEETGYLEITLTDPNGVDYRGRVYWTINETETYTYNLNGYESTEKVFGELFSAFDPEKIIRNTQTLLR